MTGVHSKWRGNVITEKERHVWVYADGTRTLDDPRRQCGRCDKPETPEGHDACLGTLPDVMNACCGHGRLREAYVQFWDRPRLAGQEALDFITDCLNRERETNP